MKNDWIVFKQPLINFSIFHFAGWRVAGASFPALLAAGTNFPAGWVRVTTLLNTQFRILIGR